MGGCDKSNRDCPLKLKLSHFEVSTNFNWVHVGSSTCLSQHNSGGDKTDSRVYLGLSLIRSTSTVALMIHTRHDSHSTDKKTWRSFLVRLLLICCPRPTKHFSDLTRCNFYQERSFLLVITSEQRNYSSGGFNETSRIIINFWSSRGTPKRNQIFHLDDHFRPF